MTVDAYLKMASSKTGALVSCAMRLGALAASAEEGVLDAVGTFGWKLGVAMQIREDLVDFWGDGPDSPVLSVEAMNKKSFCRRFTPWKRPRSRRSEDSGKSTSSASWSQRTWRSCAKSSRS